MMKRFLPLFVCAISAMFVACTGCKSDKDSGAQQMTEFEQSLNAKDTADVEKVVRVFFDNVKSEKYYDAAAMLYTRKTKNDVIRQLSNEEMDRFVKTQRQLPFESYTLDYVKFLSETENEVGCTIVLRKGVDGMPDATTKMFFTPVFHSGKWCLILTDSRKLESPISTFEQRDSLNQRYDDYKKSKLKK